MLALDEGESSGSSSVTSPPGKKTPALYEHEDGSARDSDEETAYPFSESNGINQPEKKTMVTLGWRVNVSQNLFMKANKPVVFSLPHSRLPWLIRG
jgi:hypothetical protein